MHQKNELENDPKNNKHFVHGHVRVRVRVCMREKEGKNKHYNTHFVVSELAGGASEWSGGGSDGGEERKVERSR